METATAARAPMSGDVAEPLFSHPVMGTRTAQYFRDPVSQSIFVLDPDWLAEAYTEALTRTDTGVLARNLANIDTVDAALRRAEGRGWRGVDLGAGYGLFVRGMRDRGHDFYWSDAFAPNLLARGFEAGEGEHPVATAFELLEHLPDPLAFLRESMARYGWRHLFFSATCFEAGRTPPLNWWYWAFETGQHITFFSHASLEWIAGQLDLQLSHIARDVYVMSPQRWPGMPRRGLRRLALKLRLRGRRLPSLVQADHEALRDALRARKSP